MSKRIIKYSPFTSKEIDLYKKETSSEYKTKTDMTNIALIQIRKNYLDNFIENKKLTATIAHFNKMIKGKDVDVLVRLIRTYLNK